MKNKIINTIKTHCYDGFPRRIGFPNQYLCHSIDELMTYFYQYNGSVPGIYVALFPESVKETQMFNKFYFDLDCKEDPKRAFHDAHIIASISFHYFETFPRIYFSGMKGCGVILDIEPFKFKDYRTVHERFTNALKYIGISTLDQSVVGDTARISRLPLSVHGKSKKLCIPIQLWWNYDKMIEQADSYDFLYDLSIDPAPEGTEGYELLQHWDDTAEEYKTEKQKIMKISSYTGNINLDLILSKANQLTNYREVLMYRVVIPQMLCQGKSEHEIFDYCNEFTRRSDFKRDWKKVIDYQIERFQQNGFRPLSMGRLLMEYPELRKILYVD